MLIQKLQAEVLHFHTFAPTFGKQNTFNIKG